MSRTLPGTSSLHSRRSPRRAPSLACHQHVTWPFPLVGKSPGQSRKSPIHSRWPARCQSCPAHRPIVRSRDGYRTSSPHILNPLRRFARPFNSLANGCRVLKHITLYNVPYAPATPAVPDFLPPRSRKWPCTLQLKRSARVPVGGGTARPQCSTQRNQ